MSLTRREFATVTVGAALAACFSPIAAAQERTVNRTRAIAFDAFVIFDPRSILALAKEMFGEQGAEAAHRLRALCGFLASIRRRPEFRGTVAQNRAAS
ncbi:MAG: hypothetical protein WBX25_01835 [Rhodomicrobium sp.]